MRDIHMSTRVRHQLLAVFALLSALATIAFLVLWIRSQFAIDALVYHTQISIPGAYILRTCGAGADRRRIGLFFYEERLGSDPSIHVHDVHPGFTGGWSYQHQPAGTARPWPTTSPRWLGYLGIGWQSTNAGDSVSWTSLGYRKRSMVLMIDHWLALFISLATTAAAWRGWNRMTLPTRRARRGLCMKCGYDIRATPNRCPECGATVTPLATADARG